MDHTIVMRVHDAALEEVLRALAPLMPHVKSLTVEADPKPAPPAPRPRPRPEPTMTDSTRSALTVIRSAPDKTWTVDEVGLGMSPRYAFATASGAVSILGKMGLVTRSGRDVKLTAKGAAYAL
jgi:hypothetical protein